MRSENEHKRVLLEAANLCAAMAGWFADSNPNNPIPPRNRSEWSDAAKETVSRWMEVDGMTYARAEESLRRSAQGLPDRGGCPCCGQYREECDCGDELARLTTLRPISELTDKHGAVLCWPFLNGELVCDPVIGRYPSIDDLLDDEQYDEDSDWLWSPLPMPWRPASRPPPMRRNAEKGEKHESR